MKHVRYLRAPLSRALGLFASSVALSFTPLSLAQSLETVTIEGEGLEIDSANKPYSLLPNTTFIAQPGATVAEKMNGTPGVSQSSFSAGASRPVIRGQDSDRIKILRNSSASVDASSLSPDHGVPIDPLTVKQVEITRGPAALAYGGNAVGGVVNIVDERIARQASNVWLGELNTELFGPANTKAAGIKLMAPTTNGFNLRLDAFDREEKDLRTPTFTDPNGNRVSRIANSSLETDGGGIGLSYLFNGGYVGASLEAFNSNYGVPQTQPPEVIRIDLKQERFSIEGESRWADASQLIRYRLSKTDYQHQEFEDGQAATLFKNDGINGRLEWFNSLGQVGAQFEQSDFEAVGSEAFVPPSKTDTYGLYYLGAHALSAVKVEYGLRFDTSQVAADSTGVNTSSGAIIEGAGFTGPAFNRDFNAISASIGLNWKVSNTWEMGATISRSERAPSSSELLADGLHVATSAYEKGNLDLIEERSTNVELINTWRLQGNAEGTTIKATAFYTDFSNYIGQFQRQGANATVDIDGEAVPVYDFQHVPANFYGLEFEASTSGTLASWQTKPSLVLDLVRAKRTDTDENIPRQTPLRIHTKVTFERQGWTLEPSVVFSDSSRPGVDESPTQSHTVVNFSLAKAVTFGKAAGQVYVNLINLTDELAYNANTFETVRYFTPQAGRSARLGVKLLF